MRNIIDTGGLAASTNSPKIFPVKNATVPYWRSELHPIDEHRSTEDLPSECDVAIIGAGLSGVATAYHLVNECDSDSALSIVLLEARQVCSGATGRNGGHCKVKTGTIPNLIKQHGYEAAMEFVDLVTEQPYAMKRTVETEKLDCEFELRRSFDVLIDQSDADELVSEFAAGVEAGEEWTRQRDFVGPRYVEQVTSIHGAKGAFSCAVSSLWPYKFVSQLLSRLVDRKAVNLQTNTPVEQITKDRDSGASILHTARGSLKAKKVVFATNGYTGGISSHYLNKIVPTRATATRISPSSPVSPHLSNTYNITYEQGHADYLNPRPDGGIVVGGGQWTYNEDLSKWYNVWDDSVQLEEARPHFDGLMQRHFGGWENSGAKIDSMWTGIQGRTTDEQPHIGEVPGSNGSQYVIAGFNGGGMGLIFSSAKGLAMMVREGASFENTGLPRIFKTTKERLSKTMSNK